MNIEGFIDKWFSAKEPMVTVDYTIKPPRIFITIPLSRKVGLIQKERMKEFGKGLIIPYFLDELQEPIPIISPSSKESIKAEEEKT